jgi:hypothetical protein
MSKTTEYHQILRTLPDWEPYLRAESHLPGPRGNLELAQAAADEATPEQIERLLSYGPDIAAENTPDAFLAVCGTIALGRLLAEGNMAALPRLRELANDPRWRVRESVAMALQRWGDADMDGLIAGIRSWALGTPLEQRALAAGLCEPRLLGDDKYARATLNLLNQITHSILFIQERKTEAFQALRKGLGYCWSVAIAALPEEGKAYFKSWVNTPDPDIRWILRENLKKNRLAKMDAVWVDRMRKVGIQ